MSESLREIAGELRAAGRTLMPQVRGVIAKGAVNIKGQLRDELAGSAHFGQAASAVSYDIDMSGDRVEASIGAVTEGRVVGDLGAIAYFGGSHGGGGTVADPEGALLAEFEAVAEHMADLLEPW